MNSATFFLAQLHKMSTNKGEADALKKLATFMSSNNSEFRFYHCIQNGWGDYDCER